MNDEWGVFDLARYTENFAALDGAAQCEIWTHLHVALTGEKFQTDIEQADHAMYEHKALRSDGVSGLTNHRSIHGC